MGKSRTPNSKPADRDKEDRYLCCKICGYSWKPRKEGNPVKCPSCRSIRWNSEIITTNVCKHCNHRWISEEESPKKCPKCQSTRWNQYPSTYKCERCGHVWASRTLNPKMCPSCKSQQWNEPIRYWICPICSKHVPIRNNTRINLCPVCDKNRRINVCRLCRHEWKSSRRIIPKICPRCRSPNWSGTSEGGGKLIFQSPGTHQPQFA